MSQFSIYLIRHKKNSAKKRSIDKLERNTMPEPKLGIYSGNSFILFWSKNLGKKMFKSIGVIAVIFVYIWLP